MFEHLGWWLPDGEVEVKDWMSNSRLHDGQGQYQYDKLRLAVKQVRNFRTAVDVGAHVGLWSRHLAALFQRVVAFEPLARHRECFVRNVTAGNVELHPIALGSGESPRSVAMQEKAHHSGASRVNLAAPGTIELRTLDSFDLQDVDFVKIDVEGFELFVLQGALATLKRCRPVLIVEQKPKNAARFGLREQQALEWLLAEGWCITGEMGRDFILQRAEAA